ncbi:MAG: alcohol dehydrogenase catalytic domain-containing protein [Syntrophomonadaceae bacterium]|jgi:alcohol dehydrogenase|nr:alcohol dehydrogenase catalytic domain-containing protein [Syntrophomonadaceae bacterium]
MKQKTMKALVYHGPHNISLDDVAVPQLQKDTDVIARVTISTICTSDVHVFEGLSQIVKPPRILGHEFCAEIVEVGSAVQGFKIGDRVHCPPLSFCGECAMCKLGRVGACQNAGGFGLFTDGCQAEYVRIPYANNCLIPIPDDMTDKDVLLLGDMLATALFGVNNAEVKVGQTVAVIGSGPVGLCSCLLAKKVRGAKVIVLDKIQERIDLALKAGVADIGINVQTQDAAQLILEATGGKGVDSAIETAGNSQSFGMALQITAAAGIVSSVALYSTSFELPLPTLVFKNLTIRMGIQRIQGIPELLGYIKDGTINTDFLLTHQAPLNDIIKGYEVFGAQKDGCVKWVVTPYENK